MTQIGDKIQLDDGLYEVIDRWPQEVEVEVPDGKGGKITKRVVQCYGLAVRRIPDNGQPPPKRLGSAA